MATNNFHISLSYVIPAIMEESIRISNVDVPKTVRKEKMFESLFVFLFFEAHSNNSRI